MIKKLILFTILLTTAAVSAASVYEYDIVLPEPEFIQTQGHMLVTIPGCMQIGIEGQPLRPHYPVSLALPPGETLDRIELLPRVTKSYPLMLQVLPKQMDRPLSWGVSEKEWVKDPAVYALKTYQPDKIKTGMQWYRGVGVLMGTLDPISYHPQDGQVDVMTSFTLKLTTKPDQKDERLTVRDKTILTRLVQNPEILASYGMAASMGEEALIITTDQYRFLFETLADHYAKYGIHTRIISIEDIQYSGISGRDIQQQIRNTIRDLYLYDGLDYVLLGGDNSIVPYRGVSCNVLSGEEWISSDDIPADMYYAALDGEWDRDEDGIFGEYNVDTGYDEADLMPELAIGRFPAADTLGLQNMIEKSIRYQTSPVIADMDKHTFFGEFLYANPESWGADYLELLIGERSDNGYTTQGLPANLTINKWYDQDSLGQWDQSTIRTELANGTSFVHHDGHSNYTYMMKYSTSQINDSDFVTVDGIHHTTPIFYSHGCNCGGFDKYGCIASRILTSPYISVGGVFNSRYGWFNEGQTEGPAIHLHREFENAIYGLGFDHFGWAHTLSKIMTAPWVTASDQHEQNALRWNVYTQNILGDPLMRIYTDRPEDPGVSFDMGSLEYDLLKATITRGSDPVEYAGLAVLGPDGTSLGFGKTDPSGYVEIRLPRPLEIGDSLFCYVSGYDLILFDTVLVAFTNATDITEDYVLLTNYPNPFNPVTTIDYTLPLSTNMILTLFDINGRSVKELYNGHQVAGRHKTELDAAGLSSGIYICRLTTDDHSVQKKLILLK